MEILDTQNFTLKKRITSISNGWLEATESDKVFVKLMPYSEYVALAKHGEKEVRIHYYGDKGLADRIIKTDFSEIVDLKLGKNEKLLYIIDAAHDVLAEYYAKEMGCLQAEGVTGCNDFFLDTEIKC